MGTDEGPTFMSVGWQALLLVKRLEKKRQRPKESVPSWPSPQTDREEATELEIMPAPRRMPWV
jgi:hypothetical protein